MVEVPVGVKLKGEPSKENSYCNPEMTQPHHWIIESARGASSLGKCKFCRKVRSFKNSDIVDWRLGLGRSEKFINLPFGFQFERDDDV